MFHICWFVHANLRSLAFLIIVCIAECINDNKSIYRLLWKLQQYWFFLANHKYEFQGTNVYFLWTNAFVSSNWKKIPHWRYSNVSCRQFSLHNMLGHYVFILANRGYIEIERLLFINFNGCISRLAIVRSYETIKNDHPAFMKRWWWW